MKKWPLYLLYFSNIVIYLVLVALWISIPGELTLNISLSLFNFCFSAVIFIKDKENLKKYYLSHKFKKFSEVFLSALLIFCILGVLNHLFYKNPSQWDLTRNQHNSLSPQTVKILKSLKNVPEINAFSRKENRGRLKALLDLYRFENHKLKINYIDAELRPDLVKKFKITTLPTIHIRRGQRERKVLSSREGELTNAIVKVSRDKDPLVYYSMGHSEVDPFEKGRDGLSHLMRLLKGSLFEVRPIHLAGMAKIPDKVDSLIIWGPREGFHENELTVIDLFLKRGGKLFVGIDPDFSKKDKLKGLRNLLKKWGIHISNDLVVDSLNNYSGSKGSIPLIKKFPKENPLTKGFKGPLFFPLVSSVQKVEAAGGRPKGNYFFPVKTTHIPASWAEKNVSEVNSGKVSYSPGTDTPGPIPLMVGWESLDKKHKIVAFGNTSFVVNGYAHFGQNFIFFLKGMSWLNKDKSLTSFKTPKIIDSPVFISSPHLGIIFYFSVLFIPLLMFSFALIFYRRSIKL
ncbi:GldG family protein [Bacteriovoracales bacterium]|nr:GldG family protein [Bacteriovoracales bacterium]